MTKPKRDAIFQVLLTTVLLLVQLQLSEAGLIFRRFGNHPSFVMFTIGDELGRNKGMFELVRDFKSIEPRMLHARASNNNHWDPGFAEGDEFWVTGKAGDDSLQIRGSLNIHGYRHGSIDTFPPRTLGDFMEMPKYPGRVQVADYGLADLPNARVIVTINDDSVPAVAFPPVSLNRGGVADVGTCSLQIGSSNIHAPRKLTLAASIEGADIHNTRPLWIHPPTADGTPTQGVIVSRSLGDAETKAHLDKGSLPVCAIDAPAIQDKPEARQMLHSLLRSAEFDLKTEIPGKLLKTFLP